MKNNYLIECIDFILIKEKINELISKNNFTSAFISTYDIEQQPLDNAIEDLDTYSLFGDKKVIVIKNVFAANDNKKLERLFKYIKNSNENNLLILTTNKLDNRLTFVKDIKKSKDINIINIEQDAYSYTKKLLKDYKIDNFTITQIVTLCKDDITKINNECNKLMLFKIDEKEISRDDVDSIVVKKLGDSSDLLFSLIKYIILKDKKNSFKTYLDLKEYNIDANSIIGLMASQLRLIEQIKLLSDKNLNNQEIMSTLKLKSIYQVKKIKEYIYNYSYNDVHSFIKRLASLDLSIKSGKTNIDSAIDMLILNL